MIIKATITIMINIYEVGKNNNSIVRVSVKRCSFLLEFMVTIMLKTCTVKKLVMVTVDNKLVGEAIGRQLGLDEVHAELLPDQKVEKLELLEKEKKIKGKLLFVGDGINDAP